MKNNYLLKMFFLLFVSFFISEKVFCLLPSVFYKEDVQNSKSVIISELSSDGNTCDGKISWSLRNNIKFCHIYISSEEYLLSSVLDCLIQKFKNLENLIFDKVYLEKEDRRTLYNSLYLFDLEWAVEFIDV